MPYYGLYIPAKGSGSVSSSQSPNTSIALSGNNTTHQSLTEYHPDSPFVFHKKCEALDVLKKHRDARLKEFLSEDEAIRYAQTGFEIVQNKHNDSSRSSSIAPSVEKAAFRAPSKHELIEFRKIIEAGDYERVKTMIWENPLYLVSPGDTPTTLKEGYRYNAMHVCAITKRPLVATLILETVSDPKFTDLLTGRKGDRQVCQELCANLLDYYLNIPEKGRSETPLHLAAKNGCLEMIEVLTSYPQCKMIRNHENLLPKDIICDRVCKPNPDLIKKIDLMLNERFFVPVIRCSDGSLPPHIGQPFSSNEPPKLNCDPMSPEVEIKALAGPMNKEQAKQFYHRWKTPPRTGSNTRTVSTPIANSNTFISPCKLQRSLSFSNSNIKRSLLFNTTPQDKDKEQRSCSFNYPHRQSNGYVGTPTISRQFGKVSKFSLEHIAVEDECTSASNDENYEMANPCPTTPSLKFKKDAFYTHCDTKMNSPMLSPINAKRRQFLFDQSQSPGFKERHIKNSDTEKGLECIGRELAKERNVEWREYWDFLNEFVDISSSNGLQKLENYLAKLQLIIENEPDTTNKVSTILDNVCSALDKLNISNTTSTFYCKIRSRRNGMIDEITNPDIRSVSMSGIGKNTKYTSVVEQSSSSSSASTPYTYVEKSLQVHARRITKTIVHNIDSAESINDTLMLELRRIKSLIYSFKQDKTFSNVNFSKVHSRISNLVTIFLLNSQEISASMTSNIVEILSYLLSAFRDRREHFECVCKRIKVILESPNEQILPENLKTEEMCCKVWSMENDCDCQWENNLSRKTSRRNRIETILKNNQRMQLDEEDNAKITTKVNGYHYLLQNSTKDGEQWLNCRNDTSDNEDEDIFWSDAGSESESTEDEKEVWATPPESQSRMSPLFENNNDNDKRNIYIFGNEPTKRDLDVLNAIFHLDIDALSYPHILAWKTNLLRFTNDEMDYFPSPRISRKPEQPNRGRNINSQADHIFKSPQLLRSHSYSTLNKQQQNIKQLSPTHSTISKTAKDSGVLWKSCDQKLLQQQSQNKLAEDIREGGSIRNQLSSVKRLFMSPKLMKGDVRSLEEINNLSGGQKSMPVYETRRPLTPMNKLRGLFSSYREPTIDVSKSFKSSSEENSSYKSFSDRMMDNTSSTDETTPASALDKSMEKNLSLINVSTFK